MNRPSLFLASLLAATLPAAADPAPRLTPAEREKLQVDAASAAAPARASREEVKQEAAATRTAVEQTNREVAEFIQQAALTGIAVEPPPETQAAVPLDVKPGPNDTVIEADDGMYFDAEKGILVYLKNVRLNNPDFSLSGANELKVYLEKKPEKPKDGKPGPDGKPSAESKPEDGKPEKAAKPVKSGGLMDSGGNFGDVERIVATGKVHIVQKATEPGKDAVEASAAVVTYNAKTGELVLNGGFPWIKNGGNYYRAKEVNQYVRIQKNGNMTTEGNLEMIFQIDQSKLKKDDKNKSGEAKPNR